MRLTTKLVALLCLIPVLGMPHAHAQKGKVILPKATVSKGIHPDGEPGFGNVAIYILRVGSTPNSTATDIVDPGTTNPGLMFDLNGDAYIQSDSSGNFDLTGAYYSQCNADSDIIYFEAVGGDIGSVYNPILSFLTLPSSTQTCGYYYYNSSTATIVLSDFTNVAAAFGAGTYASYSKSSAHYYDSFGTYPANYTSLGVVLDAVNNVIASSSGFYGGGDSNVQQQLNTLADVVAPCLDSNGGTGSGTNCGNLISATTQGQFSSPHLPTNPLAALVSMAQFPTNNVTTQFNLISSRPPWLPNDSSAPSGGWLVPVNGSSQPTISSSTAGSATHNTSSFTIYGSNFGTSTSAITVVGAGQNLPVTGAYGTSITVSIPNHLSKGALGVYVSGVASNFIQFTIN